MNTPTPQPQQPQRHAVPPEELLVLEQTEPKTVAAGIPAVISALKHVAGESGGRGLRALFSMNQQDGFDCAGCAWPDPAEHRSLNEYCENGAKALAEEATHKRADAAFFAKYSLSEISSWSDYTIGKSGRLTEPMILRAGSDHYEPIRWEDAFALIAKELNALNSPDEAVFYTSGRTSNEAAFLYQLFVRLFGTNNLPDCSNMCHESSGKALKESVGVGKGTVSLEDFDHAEVILVIGQNPGTNHPRMLSALQSAKRKGCTIISINPLPETGLLAFKNPQEAAGWLGKGTALTDIFLQVRINGDIALIKGLLKSLLEAEEHTSGSAIGSVFDYTFIAEYTTGFEEMMKDIRQTEWTEIEQASGVDKADILKAAEVLRSKERIIACWAMGLTQHKNAVVTIQYVANLLLAKGSIGKRGAGLCPVRGHSNVQGDRTMGIWEAPSDAFLDALGAEFNFKPPRKHGFDVVQAIKAMHTGRATVFIAMGGNFLSATPDTEYTAEALSRCSLTVHVSTKLNRSHVIAGKQALILPCLGRSERDTQLSGEQFVTVEDSMSIVHRSQGRLQPASEQLLSEPAIVAHLAQAVFTLGAGTHAESGRGIDWAGFADNYDRIRERIARVIPGFHEYNKRVRQPDGFYLDNPARRRVFVTSTEKAHFVVAPIPQHDLLPEEFLLMTIRTHDQFNTTIYGLNDRYRGIYNERRIVFMHPDDMREAGFREREAVDITSRFVHSGITEERVAKRFLVIPFSIPRRCLAAYFPETNVLVPVDSTADKSNTPTSKSIVVRLTRHEANKP